MKLPTPMIGKIMASIFDNWKNLIEILKSNYSWQIWQLLQQILPIVKNACYLVSNPVSSILFYGPSIFLPSLPNFSYTILSFIPFPKKFQTVVRAVYSAELLTIKNPQNIPPIKPTPIKQKSLTWLPK
jgi:hypothetical protein